VSDGDELLGLLAEPVRLRVAAALVLGRRTPVDIAQAADVDKRVALQALTRLEAGGLAERDGDGWRFVADRLTASARAAAPRRPAEDHGATDPAAAMVLGRYLRGGRLLSIPSARGKRLVILDHLARMFEPGVRYPEREVNAYLRAFHDDVAALRRYLVDEGLLSREAGVYWRSGGPVEV
jgi:hypothetical protein